MHYDELVVGSVYKTAERTVTKEDILAFAAEYDPQYMHLDEEKAAKSIFGGLIASGIHTLSITFRLWADLKITGDDIVAGQSLDRVRFLKPVYPGDTLSVVAELTDKKPNRLNSEQGFFKLRLTTYNQRSERVLSTDLTGLVRKLT